MEPSLGKQIGLAVLGWILYFLAIFLICHFIYIRLRGKPPGKSAGQVILHGRPVSAETAWQDRDRRLRRRFIGIVIGLMLLPLFLPLILKTLFS